MVPDTRTYMIAGYVVIFSGMAVYVLSLMWRWRRRLAELAQVEEELREIGKAP